MEDVESLGDHGCTVKAFDELLTTYSSKALEFQVVQMERSQTKGEWSSKKVSLKKSLRVYVKKRRMVPITKEVAWPGG